MRGHRRPLLSLDALRNWVEEQIGPVEAVTTLSGATSATVEAVASARGRFVVKRYGTPLQGESEPAAREAAALDAIAGTGLPAPELVAVDPDGSRTGAPTVLMTRLEGAPLVSVPDPAGAAGLMLRIHAASAGTDRVFRRYNPAPREVPRWSRRPGMWHRAFEAAASAPPPQAVFIHRDLNPGNVLWADGELSGVVDWLGACRGPAGIDLARYRLDLTLAGRSADAAAVLAAYEAAAPGGYDPVWDVVDALDLVPFYAGPVAAGDWAAGTPARRVRLERFLSEALARAG